RVRGAGEAIRGGKPGDLYVRIHVKEDKRFERDGSTIFSTLDIGFTQAALGAEIKAETVDGPTDVSIGAGTQSGTQIRIRAKGVVSGATRGDHVFVVQVVTPTKLSREQKKLLEELDLKE
ncbi:molecular chaperone DnaJ, partial [bacterium]|nr:molecular chaperone DnaJ [bacterium]